MRLLVIDGYNIIGAWRDLTEMAARSLDDARDKLIGLMTDHASYTGEHVLIVFDAHFSGRLSRSVRKNEFVSVVFTKAQETADHYIERTVDQYRDDPRAMIRVATSDALEQSTILARGAARVPARELYAEVTGMRAQIRASLRARERVNTTNALESRLSPEQLEKLERMRRSEM